MLAISARIAGFLLLVALVYCYYMHYSSLKFGGGDHYVAEEIHIIVPNKQIIFPGATNNNIRGRRIMSDHNSRRRETMEEIGVRGKDSKKSRILVSKGDYQGRFVAFNADYKGPRHHPPKNN